MNQVARLSTESETRCESEILKIDAFYEQISLIFQSAYNRIVYEKRSKLAQFKNLFRSKLEHFESAW